MQGESKPYPGEVATPNNIRQLADEYRGAAHDLMGRGKRGKPSSWAPARMTAIQAIELYLNALLLARGVNPGLPARPAQADREPRGICAAAATTHARASRQTQRGQGISFDPLWPRTERQSVAAQSPDGDARRGRDQGRWRARQGEPVNARSGTGKGPGARGGACRHTGLIQSAASHQPMISLPLSPTASPEMSRHGERGREVGI